MLVSGVFNHGSNNRKKMKKDLARALLFFEFSLSPISHSDVSFFTSSENFILSIG